MQERRREERLALSGFSLWLKTSQGVVICEVVNISRLGVRLRLPSDVSFDQLPGMKPGKTAKAVLKFGAHRYDLKLRLLSCKGEQIGCAFEFDDVETQQSLFSILTPRFTASTILEAPPESLAQGVKQAYFGQDFRVTLFAGDRGFVISTLGVDCSVSGDFLSIDVESDAGDGEAYRRREREVLSWISSVLEAWDTCPNEMERLFGKAKQKFEAAS